MTEIHRFYEELMDSHEFKVGVAHLRTGQALSGAMQNANGSVLGSYYPNGPGKGGMSTEASFSRSHLNAPIQVVLTVKLIQYYPRP